MDKITLRTNEDRTMTEIVDSSGKQAAFKPGDRVWVGPAECWATVVRQQLKSYDGEESFWGNVRVRYDDGVEGTSNSWQLKLASLEASVQFQGC